MPAPSMTWNAITAIATAVSTLAFLLTALYSIRKIRSELKVVEKDRYLSVTNDLFSVWQSTEFMTDQLWLLHRMDATTWEEFVQTHRADAGEAAFHRVGSFYDRIGTLVRMGVVDEKEILSTLGAYAIAVWQRIEPLVREARRIENSALFDDFERLLPACYECYVPTLGRNAHVRPFSLDQGAPSPAADGAPAEASPAHSPQDSPQPVPTGEAQPPTHAGISYSPVRPPEALAVGTPVRSPEPRPRPEAARQTRTERGRPREDAARSHAAPEDRISQAEVKRRLAKGPPLTLLDARWPAQHAQHPQTLPGALNVPPDEMEAHLAGLPPDREIAVYCA